MYRIRFTNGSDSEICPIRYDSEDAAKAAGIIGISVGAGWTGFHIV